ncbi:hypothetical protein J1781_17860 [Rahnella sp. C60]|uniref:Uncharacterized protein n=1 Tax=Rahnella perminowiae TaxID=2816244 RepID=A0ABS6KZP0_9GAMM|nr:MULTISPECIES: hypothetical protein [Rahnella]UJD87941.1 hypothetical protein FS594_03565 [Rahnella aquatilis]MBU9816703.1 hypothetical protein [Rahnella perminowiae]MBU9835073.1 hypothetical protein [Rahnella perminowiae]MCR9003023.1 hypothetical protein [Rahnella perminowiae]MCX2942226.1 hypothetical protein [Rahnella perminowiae]
MITVLRCAVLALLFSAGVRAETTVPAQEPASAAAKPVVKTSQVVKTPVSKAPLIFPPGSGVMHIALAPGKKPLDVFTYQPVGADETTPVVMVMTGVDRNAATYRNDWMTVADQYHLRVIVPHFSEQDFPGAAGYNLGNLTDSKTHRRLPKSQWAFSIVDNLFTTLQKQGITRQKQYYLFGNSAGCQFVHRMLTLLPEPNVKAAVCAAAGWWTLPDTDQRWPYGLREAPVVVSQQQLNDYFAKPVLIAVGAEDDDPENHLLRKSKQAMAQGTNRLERAESYFTTSQQRAEQNNTPFNWHFMDLSDIGHSGSKMSVFAAGQFAWFEQHNAFHL